MGVQITFTCLGGRALDSGRFSFFRLQRRELLRPRRAHGAAFVGLPDRRSDWRESGVLPDPWPPMYRHRRRPRPLRFPPFAPLPITPLASLAVAARTFVQWH